MNLSEKVARPRYVAKPTFPKCCFLIGGETNSRGGVLQDRQGCNSRAALRRGGRGLSPRGATSNRSNGVAGPGSRRAAALRQELPLRCVKTGVNHGWLRSSIVPTVGVVSEFPVCAHRSGPLDLSNADPLGGRPIFLILTTYHDFQPVTEQRPL
jgi:hypothetical protein